MATTTWPRPDRRARRRSGPRRPPARRSQARDRRCPRGSRTPRSRATRASPRHSVGRVEDHVAARRPVEPGLPERGVDLGLDRRRGPGTRACSPYSAASSTQARNSSTWYGWSASDSVAGLLEVAVDAVLAGERDQALRGCRRPRARAARARRGSGGSRWPGRGSGSPRRSRRSDRSPRRRRSPPRGPTTRSAGSVSVSAIAVHRPVNPAADDRDVDVERLAGASGGSHGRGRPAQPVADRLVGLAAMGGLGPRRHAGHGDTGRPADAPMRVGSRIPSSSCESRP